MAQIGSKGGSKSKRKLSAEDARMMVKLREARRAYKKYYAMCFWHMKEDLIPKRKDLSIIAKYLKRYGDRQAYIIGRKLCQ